MVNSMTNLHAEIREMKTMIRLLNNNANANANTNTNTNTNSNTNNNTNNNSNQQCPPAPHQSKTTPAPKKTRHQ